VFLIDGWLTRPARAAPRIFVQASGDPFGFKLPDNFELFASDHGPVP
jgi:hypothetical protein